eukprot:TRINITY_DN2931_c0_g1_i2.p1 TRINITY_DN2931_c0_g1~~TRINITY_DN2931_c0_g1_i2.p1  ORF type:complete len:499 (+),score=104.15 TRINITY_DN2931_c0_g1_i2:476-1972(+)
MFVCAVGVTAFALVTDWLASVIVDKLEHLVKDKNSYEAKGWSLSESKWEYLQRAIAVTAKITKSTTPLALGVGLAWNYFLMRPWRTFGYYAIAYNVTESRFLAREVVMRLIRAIFWTLIVIGIQKYHAAKVRELPSRRERSTWVRFYMHAFGYMIKSSSFCLAWMWNDLAYFIGLRVVFECHYDYTDCGPYTIWLNVLYAIVFTYGAAVLLLPTLKQNSSLLKRLDGFYAKELMTNDTHFIKMENANNALVSAMLGIMVGWSWTQIFSAECLNDATPSCPSTMNLESFLGFFVCVALYVFVGVVMFHRFMEANRLMERCNKVGLLTEGDTYRFFQGLDQDNDGQITEKELTKFMAAYDLNPTHFQAAFERADILDGEGDSEAGLADLMAIFNEIMVEERGTFGKPKKRKQHQPSLTMNQPQCMSLGSSPRSRQGSADSPMHMTGKATTSGDGAVEVVLNSNPLAEETGHPMAGVVLEDPDPRGEIKSKDDPPVVTVDV